MNGATKCHYAEEIYMTDAAGEQQHETVPTDEFKKMLVEVIPHLRAFGHSLTGNIDLANDLAQEALMKAWVARGRFHAGTSLKAWCFVILRNTYISQMRRKKFTGEYNEIAAERILSAPASQQEPLHLSDVQRALLELPDCQREAIILIGAGGFSYEDAAEICGCAIGTIKSRVSRARQTLEEIMDGGTVKANRNAVCNASDAVVDIMSSVKELSGYALAKGDVTAIAA